MALVKRKGPPAVSRRNTRPRKKHSRSGLSMTGRLLSCQRTSHLLPSKSRELFVTRPIPALGRFFVSRLLRAITIPSHHLSFTDLCIANARDKYRCFHEIAYPLLFVQFVYLDALPTSRQFIYSQKASCREIDEQTVKEKKTR